MFYLLIAFCGQGREAMTNGPLGNDKFNMQIFLLFKDLFESWPANHFDVLVFLFCLSPQIMFTIKSQWYDGWKFMYFLYLGWLSLFQGSMNCSCLWRGRSTFL